MKAAPLQRIAPGEDHPEGAISPRGMPMDDPNDAFGNDAFGYDHLAFFGRVNASISHELKNVMAIISETAGLLGDLADMAADGTPVSPEMLKNCTGSIVEEIQRGFVVIRQMNRFAHSIDVPCASIDLMEILDLAVHLTGYLSFSGTTEIDPCENGPPVVLTSPFVLQSIVYQCLASTYKHTGSGATITLSVRADEGAGWRIRFSGFSVGNFESFPEPEIQSMAASIGAVIHCDRSGDLLEIKVPENNQLT